mmetsp:Transcript_6870/g.21775  ORF Transcript_6870/g.21775 Transcript_6870/m.21775 type:complete len:687 (-) Transcript_6870:17-2077(-)|eukprot:CAMPEP_0196780468 /NCGR_PEP_ID=MMETSP1104-20130614/7909_1 /TAXON_ID=33652 /ORGANISM="Cafeteria sp., Strain Caron Lab Isolate" /LENGTH=686 /DNA_ID=CAMNT_0042150677 /DNA_START=87 /DNA_END=2147 /DNA_ORIENTATION=-
MSRGGPELDIDAFDSVVDGLQYIYFNKIRPLEQQFKFDMFFSPLLEEGDFSSKPLVLVLGQYSVGKTTFIQYLLEREFPGMRIGPEPTTDRFMAIMHGDDDRVTPGNAAAIQADLPFRGLARFGTGFLSKFEVSQLKSRILRSISIVDSPGVLSGEKQRIHRTYEFTDVVEWFAERSDIILLLFDAHKLDISDEFKRTIEALAGQDDKIRVILNKADKVNNQQLMRVYGALMWSLGKVVKSPEVARVYIGSFWDEPYTNEDNTKLFDAERDDLLRDLKQLPRYAAVRKANELVKRARLVKVHAHIISHLRSKMPSLWGKSSKQQELCANLLDHFRAVQRSTQLPPSDFPNLHRYRSKLESVELHKFPKLNIKLVQEMDRALAYEIPRLLERLGAEQRAGLGPAEAMRDSEFKAAGGVEAVPVPMPGEHSAEYLANYARLRAFYQKYNPSKIETISTILDAYEGKIDLLFRKLVRQYGPEPAPPVSAAPPSFAPGAEDAAAAASFGWGEAVTALDPSDASSTPAAASAPPAGGLSASNPFAAAVTPPADAWAVTAEAAKRYDAIFQAAGPQGGRLDAGPARDVLVRSGLPVEVLGKIWELSDMERRGSLDAEEFAVALYLVERAKHGVAVPDALPPNLVPPSRRVASPVGSGMAAAGGTPVAVAMAATAAPAASGASSPETTPSVAI